MTGGGAGKFAETARSLISGTAHRARGGEPASLATVLSATHFRNGALNAPHPANAPTSRLHSPQNSFARADLPPVPAL